jgi:hypothetical protein
VQSSGTPAAEVLAATKISNQISKWREIDINTLLMSF